MRFGIRNSVVRYIDPSQCLHFLRGKSDSLNAELEHNKIFQLSTINSMTMFSKQRNRRARNVNIERGLKEAAGSWYEG